MAAMRDPARIAEMCELLMRVWAKDPDLRLGQLLVNAIRPNQPCPQIFHVEDGHTRKGLERMAEGRPELRERRPHAGAGVRWKPVDEVAKSTVIYDGASTGHFDVGELFCEVLEIRFAGEYRSGSEGRPDALAMALRVNELLWRTTPDTVLLDLSRLTYSWGDNLLDVVEAVARFDAEVPIGLVILGGPKSGEAMRTLGLTVHHTREDALEMAQLEAVERAREIG
jgi:hypothetical protein